MTLIRRASPWGDLLSLRQTMDRLFEESFARPGSPTADSETTAPSVETAHAG